jgi:hypothetical protein
VVSATPRPLYPRERPGTHCTGGRSGRVRKISPPPGFDPRTVQPVASRYTDCVIRPTNNILLSLRNKTIVGGLFCDLQKAYRLRKL